VVLKKNSNFFGQKFRKIEFFFELFHVDYWLYKQFLLFFMDWLYFHEHFQRDEDIVDLVEQEYTFYRKM